MISSAKKHSRVISPVSKTFLEIDVWLPELHLAFEYQVNIKEKKRENKYKKKGIIKKKKRNSQKK